MKNIIVGTAGHIDHGKTCLIKALTGIETDRLKEEKQRGITIELGFANLPNDRNIDIGIVDVPGHEKFVKHMLAGIGGIDIVLLVIAADEGIMPQTTEHFEILKMLRIKKGIVVLTKVDMVDEDWLEMVKEDVRDAMQGTFLEQAPMICVSSHTGENIDVLKEKILEMALEGRSRQEGKEMLRLPVDRVFTIDGFGTVITGTLMEGTVETGDEILIYPGQKKAKVRNVQVHGRTVDSATAGHRTAINLAGIKKEDIKRGDVIAAPGLMENTMILDVKIDMFDKTARTLKNGSRVHFYYGAAETLCKVVLLDKEELTQGESGYAQLRFEEEIAVKRDDRFILRFYSPLVTIGGGKILNASPVKRKRYDEKALTHLRKFDSKDKDKALAVLFAEESAKLLDVDQIIKKFGKEQSETVETVNTLIEMGTVVKISSQLVLHKDFVETLKSKTRRVLEDYHNENPVKAGMPKEEFRMRMKQVLHVEDIKHIEALINFLMGIEIIKDMNGTMALKEFKVSYTPQQEKLADEIEAIYKKAWLEPPDVTTALQEFKDMKMATQMLEAMCAEGRLRRLNHQYYIQTAALDRAMKILMDTMKQQGSITLAEYRGLIGTSRKYAILILEYTDEKKITRMVGDSRVLC